MNTIHRKQLTRKMKIPASENQCGVNSCNSANQSKGTKRTVKILTEMTAKSKKKSSRDHHILLPQDLDPLLDK